MTKRMHKVRIVCIDRSGMFIGPQSFDNKIHDFCGDLTDTRAVTAFLQKHFKNLATFIPGHPSGYDKYLNRVTLYLEKESFHSYLSCVWLEPVPQTEQSDRNFPAMRAAKKKVEEKGIHPVVIEAGIRYLKMGASTVVTFALHFPEARAYCDGQHERLLREAYGLIEIFGPLPVASIIEVLEPMLEDHRRSIPA